MNRLCLVIAFLGFFGCSRDGSSDDTEEVTASIEARRAREGVHHLELRGKDALEALTRTEERLAEAKTDVRGGKRDHALAIALQEAQVGEKIANEGSLIEAAVGTAMSLLCLEFVYRELGRDKLSGDNKSKVAVLATQVRKDNDLLYRIVVWEAAASMRFAGDEALVGTEDNYAALVSGYNKLSSALEIAILQGDLNRSRLEEKCRAAMGRASFCTSLDDLFVKRERLRSLVADLL